MKPYLIECGKSNKNSSILFGRRRKLAVHGTQSTGEGIRLQYRGWSLQCSQIPKLLLDRNASLLRANLHLLPLPSTLSTNKQLRGNGRNLNVIRKDRHRTLHRVLLETLTTKSLHRNNEGDTSDEIVPRTIFSRAQHCHRRHGYLRFDSRDYRWTLFSQRWKRRLTVKGREACHQRAQVQVSSTNDRNGGVTFSACTNLSTSTLTKNLLFPRVLLLRARLRRWNRSGVDQ